MRKQKEGQKLEASRRKNKERKETDQGRQRRDSVLGLLEGRGQGGGVIMNPVGRI